MVSGSGAEKSTVIEKCLILAIVLLGLALILTVEYTVGPQWDISARSFNGRTLLNYLSNLSIDPRLAFGGEFLNNQVYYFEPFREPLSTPIFAFLSLFFKSTVIPYSVLLYFVYAIAVYYFSKKVGVNSLLAFSILISFYTAYFLFIPNGGEGLAVIMLMIGLVLLLDDNYWAGLFFGLAVLAKYQALAAFPVLLFLGNKRKIVIALILEAIAILAWGILDYFLWGVPFLSIIQSIHDADVPSGTGVYLLAVATALAYPLLFGGITAAAIFLSKKKFNLDWKRMKVFFLLALLTAGGYILIVANKDFQSQMRYAVFFVFSVLVICMLYLGRLFTNPKARYALATLSIILLIAAIIWNYNFGITPTVQHDNPDNIYSIYGHAKYELGVLNLSGCRVVSNDWIMLMDAGVNAYSPYFVYANTLVGPNDLNVIMADEDTNLTSYIAGRLNYPIVIFNYVGVPAGFLPNINASRKVYSDNNFTIYLPQNLTCVKG